MSVRYLYLVAVAACLGCATTSNTGEPPRNLEVITEQEIAAQNASNAYEVVQSLRPNFLRSRGRISFNTSEGEYANVYVDGRRYGDINSLRNISASQVREIHHYSAAEATTRFGTSNGGGVIELKLK